MIAAFDVGGTKIVAAALGADGVRLRLEAATPGPPGARDPGSGTLRRLAAELTRQLPTPALRAGVSFCEYVHEGRLTSSEVIAWDEQPAAWLPGVLAGAPVVVESDVRCGLLAERAGGAARGLSSAAYVSWGTGLSSALLLDGRIWAGRRGRAIALGEWVTPAGGGLEAYVSGAGMARRYAELTGHPTTGARAVLAAAERGDEAARQVAESAGHALAEALLGVAHLLDPERIILGGGLGCASDTAVHRALHRRWTQAGPAVQLVAGAVGPDAALLGAGLAAGWAPPWSAAPWSAAGLS